MLCFALVNVLCTDDVPLILRLPTSAPATRYSSHSVCWSSLPLLRNHRKQGRKKCGIPVPKYKFWIQLQAIGELHEMSEREAMSVASKTLVVYAPYAQRLNSRCRSSLYSQMQSGRLLLTDKCRTVLSVCTMPVRCFCLRNSSTVPSLPIACRLLSLQYRYPPSWSCRSCL